MKKNTQNTAATTTKKNTAVKKAEKPMPISITVRVDKKNVKTVKAASVCNMWKVNKELFKEYPTAYLFIKKDGDEFMKLHLVTKSNGKTWMKNDIEASRRKPVAKAAAEPVTDELHTIAEAEEAPAAEAPVFAEA